MGIDWIAAGFGIVGSLFLASNHKQYAKFGWFGFLAGSMCWLVYGLVQEVYSIVLVNTVFTVSESWGIYKYFTSSRVQKIIDRITNEGIIYRGGP
jgi:hypothetical protein